MMRRWTRWSAAVVGALAVLALGSVTVDGGAAGAVDGTTVTVTPATGVHDGQSVTVTITGSPDATHTVSICDRAYLDHLDDVLAPLRYCATDSGTYVTRTGTPGQPLTVPVVVRQAPTVLQGSVHCGDEPNDCVVVDWAGYDGSFSVPDPAKVTATPIDVSPTDMLVVTPHLDLPPAATVGVTGAFFQPGAVTVQECTAAWAAAPDLATAADSCGAAKTVTAAGDGTFSATASVTDPLVTRSGTSVPCGASGCVLVASSASDPAVTRALLVFGGPSLRVGQTQGLLDEQEVPITITGVEPGTVVDVGLCVTPAPGAEADCAAFSGELAVGPDGTGGGVLDAHRGFAYPRVSGLPSDCRVVGCSIIAFDRDTHAQLGRDVPVTFGPRPVVSLTPTTGLLEGQPMTFRAANLPPNQPFYVARCVDGRCPSPERVISSPTGTVDRTVAASERIGTRWLCHGRCTVRLQSGPWFDSADPSVGYTTASGSVTVTPSTGLVDEQSVTVTGSNLLATYAGPTILFPTGGWGLSQCDRAVGSTPTLVDVFTHCAIPPGGGTVAVPGSTSSTTIVARASITKILGGTTDCTTSAGACVVGLFRWEQDGTVSAHTTPISFAAAP